MAPPNPPDLDLQPFYHRLAQSFMTEVRREAGPDPETGDLLAVATLGASYVYLRVMHLGLAAGLTEDDLQLAITRATPPALLDHSRGEPANTYPHLVGVVN
jgi:hypothetical protein